MNRENPATVAMVGARPKRRLRINLSFLIMTLVTVLVGFLVLYPLGMLLFGSFWTSRPGFPGAFTLRNYVTAYADPETYQVLFNTILLVGVKTLAAATIAVALAWIVTRTDTP